MFILPIRTSIRPQRTPYANYAIITINVIIFIAQQVVTRIDPALVQRFVLNPEHPQLYQFITYAFMHGGLLHIIGNMFFLWLFGNNVNDKLGHIGYLCFFLAGAIFSGVGHALLGGASVLGASGAVAAVTGAFLVLFPQSLITVFYWLFFFIDTIEVPAIYFIGFKLIVWDNMIERSVSHIAYDAHLSGYAFGALSITALLAMGFIKSNNLDLWSFIKQWNRRRLYRDVVNTGFDPFTGLSNKSAKDAKTTRQLELEEQITSLRHEIGKRIAERNLHAAAETYTKLIELDNNQVIPKQQLLDVANQFMSDNESEQAANAYEQFLENYPNYEYNDQVQLMLGILYARYLKNPTLAKKHLSAARKNLKDDSQIKMCDEELQKID